MSWDKSITETYREMKERGEDTEASLGDLSASSCSPRCDNCRWGMELEERYDHRHCHNPDSMDGGGDVEASHSCPFFEPVL